MVDLGLSRSCVYETGSGHDNARLLDLRHATANGSNEGCGQEQSSVNLEPSFVYAECRRHTRISSLCIEEAVQAGDVRADVGPREAMHQPMLERLECYKS